MGKHAYLAMWLAAAGCGEARRADEFVQEYWDTRCEIDRACPEGESESGGDWASPCDRAAREEKQDPDRCDIIDEDQAERCLNALDQVLETTQDGSCPENPSPAVCQDVVTRRDGDKCYQGDAGRPIRVDGRPLLPTISRTDPAIATSPLRRVAGEQWLTIARLEHASVAAFGRVAAQLMALGSPLELIEDCHRAALDEVRHARLARRLADELLGGTTTFQALPLPPMPPVSLWEVARDALIEGCIGEGIAAAEAKYAARLARDDVAEVLEVIADDEARHAALAWKTLRWALEQDASLGPRLDGLLDDRLRREAMLDGTGCPELGVLSGADRAVIQQDVLHRIVRPILQTMLSDVSTRRTSVSPSVG